MLTVTFRLQLNKIDAKIMRNVNNMQQLEQKLGPASAFDYRSIVLPLVKSFLRVCDSVASRLYLLLMTYCSAQALTPFDP